MGAGQAVACFCGPGAARAYAGGAVGHVQRGDAEARDAGDHAVVLGIVNAVQFGDLLIEGHLCDQRAGAGYGLRVGDARLLGRCRREEAQRKRPAKSELVREAWRFHGVTAEVLSGKRHTISRQARISGL